MPRRGSAPSDRAAAVSARDKMAGMIDHVGIQCQDVPAAAAFYDTVLAPLGGKRLFDFGSSAARNVGMADRRRGRGQRPSSDGRTARAGTTTSRRPAVNRR